MSSSDAAYNVTADELNGLLSLNERTGDLYWKARPVEMFAGAGWQQQRACKTWNSRFAGRLAASVCPLGYVRVGLGRKSLKAHRVVFALVHGRWPDGEVDHINGNPSDNRPENLREVTHLENSRNQKLRKSSETGVSGVTLDPRGSGYVVAISDIGQKRHIGRFDLLRDAEIARKAAERALNYHQNHGRKQA